MMYLAKRLEILQLEGYIEIHYYYHVTKFTLEVTLGSFLVSNHKSVIKQATAIQRMAVV